MRKIDRIIYSAIVPPFLITVAALTFILSVNSLGQMSEILITRSASLSVIIFITAALLPSALIYTLPLSFLIGVLIGISGLSGENQITAMRACGIPIRTLLRPILVFGAAVGLATAAFTTMVVPRTNEIIAQLKNRVNLAQATSQIQPRIFNGGDNDFPKVVFYLEDLSIDKQSWSGIFLADSTDPDMPRIVMAESGSWVNDRANNRLQLHLENGASYSVDRRDPRKDAVNSFNSMDFPVALSQRLSSSPAAPRNLKPSEQPTLQLWRAREKFPAAQKHEQTIELYRRIALPCSIIPFALLGLTLAVAAPRGGRTSGFAFSLVLVILFYVLFFNGIRLASVGKLSPWIGVWGANILLASLGLILFYRVEQIHAVGHWISRFISKSGWEERARRLHLEQLRTRVARLDNSIVQSTARVARFRFPKVLDVYISKGFLEYFIWSLLVCGTLFVLFTLFDLLDDIIRNNIRAITVLDYFTFFTPQILMLVVPMSILLAVLINFGILEKNSEITAIKAGGWSLYRIAAPVFLIASLLCVNLYLLQDYVLPYANERQDDIRNQIKGRPPQTYMRLQRKWILGKSNRIYNYEYFDAAKDSFVDLNIYDIDLDSAKMLRRIHANRASIDASGLWTLEEGWIRDYGVSPSFKSIKKETLRFPEGAAYFETDMFQPKESSKKTYLELRDYIKYLMESGYNATELQVELHKKISFPLSCLVMAILAVPFSFSMGKKGAFFGIGASIAIAICYWGLSSLFEAMGAYGVLVPALAAWAPNLLFGAAGIALLFTIRT